MTTSHPKIGIRPIIDGRRGGIRESLEAMTMGMAQRVARLYSEELRYSDGSPSNASSPTPRSAGSPKPRPAPTNSATAM